MIPNSLQVVVLLAGAPLDGLARFPVAPLRRLGREALGRIHRPRVGFVLVTGKDLNDLRPAMLRELGLIPKVAGLKLSKIQPMSPIT